MPGNEFPNSGERVHDERAQAVQQTRWPRVHAALEGVLPVERLSDEEGTVFADELQSRLEERLRTTDLGAVLAARGVTAVALNKRGEVTEYRPGGTSVPRERDGEGPARGRKRQPF